MQTLLTPPHDDPLVIAGQATAGYELLRQHGTEMAKKHSPASQLPPQLDAVFVPVGGGSLIAGVAIVDAVDMTLDGSLRRESSLRSSS